MKDEAIASSAPRTWTGFYIGGGVGAGALNHSDNAYHYQTGAFASSFDDGGKGAIAVLQAGYDYQFAPRWVTGVFADVDWSWVSSQTSQNNGPFSNTGSFTRDRGWSVGARAGWLATPDTLLYVPVGLTQSHYAWDGSFFSFSSLDHNTFSTSLNGVFAGFGVETMFGEHWGLRGEYRYAWFSGSACAGSTSAQLVSICKGVNDNVDFPERLENFREQTVRAVVSYKFN